MDTTNIDTKKLLCKWNEAKEEISRLQKKIDNYKTLANQMMDERGTDTLKGDGLHLERREHKSVSMRKRDVPDDVWKQYATESVTKACWLKKDK